MKIQTIRTQPWDWKTKNEYEEVTVRQQPYLHFHYRNPFDHRDYDLFDPRYTRIKCADWEGFRDPKKYWYTTFIRDRKKLAEQMETVMGHAKTLGVIKNLNPHWANAIREIYTPLRHLEYGENVQLQYVIRYALGTPIEQCVTYQAFDKIGRAQWISQWAIDMQEEHGEFLQDGKQRFLEDPAFSLLRRYVEEVLVTEDWAEVLIAENVTLDLLLGQLMYDVLNKEALKQNDVLLSGMNLVIQQQMKWHESWALSLFKYFVNDTATSRWDYLASLGYSEWPGDYRWGRTLSDPRKTPEEEQSNKEIIGEWINKWYSKAYEAILKLEPLFKKHQLSISIPCALQEIESSVVIPLYTKYGLPLPVVKKY